MSDEVEVNHFKIVAGRSGYHTRVEMNGKVLRNCRAIHVSTGVGESTNVTVEFIGVTAEFEGEAEQLFAEVTHMGSTSKEYQNIT